MQQLQSQYRSPLLRFHILFLLAIVGCPALPAMSPFAESRGVKQEESDALELARIATIVRESNEDAYNVRQGGASLFERVVSSLREHARNGEAGDAQAAMQVWQAAAAHPDNKEARRVGLEALGTAVALDGQPQYAEEVYRQALENADVHRMLAATRVLGAWATKERFQQLQEDFESLELDLNERVPEMYTRRRLNKAIGTYGQAAHLEWNASRISGAEARLAFYVVRADIAPTSLATMYGDKHAVLSPESWWSPLTWRARRELLRVAEADITLVHRMCTGGAIEDALRVALGELSRQRADDAEAAAAELEQRVEQRGAQVKAEIVRVLRDRERQALHRLEAEGAAVDESGERSDGSGGR